ncbi:hypothetical protein SAMN04488058_101280 [Deinococcus reticulitermitis]|uniref:Uncharacterized protein n=1 Tax=Deinococcus reticulitermitis TaxID=856736 RepID=A0A1H6SET0_9DEIO|nr:hypothetical protein [Deinococcus reticulitermitis]SEI66419.1 hypothetical protein SAMN04488058_101280 [Deinococcus reticulitermitis]
MAGLEPEQLLAWITGVGGVAVGVWTKFGSSRDTAFARITGERDRLDRRVSELEKGREEDRARLDKVEGELEALRLDHKTLLDFLRDIVSGRFDSDWVKGRAADLLERFGGGKP